MANNVYSIIRLITLPTESQREILKEIEKVGICEYFLPMPGELNITSGSSINRAREILKHEHGSQPLKHDTISEQDFKEARQSFINERLYGAKDWYDWKNKNYGTKWGDYDLKVKDNKITFVTAWTPLNENIMQKFIEVFEDLHYEWGEEQGFGEHKIYMNGHLVSSREWDIPEYYDDEYDDNYDYSTQYVTIDPTMQIINFGIDTLNND